MSDGPRRLWQVVSAADGVTRWVAGTYRLASEADVTLLVEDSGPDLRVRLTPNTTIHVEAWTGHRSPMFAYRGNTYRACVLDGRWHGRYVEIWDEGTPQSGERHTTVTLGLPPAFVRLPVGASVLGRRSIEGAIERGRG